MPPTQQSAAAASCEKEPCRAFPDVGGAEWDRVWEEVTDEFAEEMEEAVNERLQDIRDDAEQGVSQFNCDAALASLVNPSQGERFYPITSLHKNDLRELFRDSDTEAVPAWVGKRIDTLTDGDMEYLAEKLAEVFCNCCYWEGLRAMFLDNFCPAEGEGQQSQADRQESEAEVRAQAA